MDDNYYVIAANADGDVEVALWEREALENHLNNDYWGEDVRVLEHVPWDGEPADWVQNTETVLLIIKGEVAVPKAVAITTKWVLP